ncbi:MAG: sigma-70 family RNA polymerase sigma factor [Saprospiraceae bacterium]
MVYGICLHYLPTEMDAEDAVMNIYIELQQKLPQHEVQNFKSWLHTFSRNHCLMFLRKHNKTKVSALESDFMQSEVFAHLEEESEFSERVSHLEKCLATLQAMQQKCIRLFYLDGQSYKEIAAREQEDIGRVRSWIQNGRRNLKICIEQQQEKEFE